MVAVFWSVSDEEGRVDCKSRECCAEKANGNVVMNDNEGVASRN